MLQKRRNKNQKKTVESTLLSSLNWSAAEENSGFAFLQCPHPKTDIGYYMIFRYDVKMLFWITGDSELCLIFKHGFGNGNGKTEPNLIWYSLHTTNPCKTVDTYRVHRRWPMCVSSSSGKFWSFHRSGGLQWMGDLPMRAQGVEVEVALLDCKKKQSLHIRHILGVLVRLWIMNRVWLSVYFILELWTLMADGDVGVHMRGKN